MKKLVVVGLNVLADGTDTVFKLDLKRDPYHVFVEGLVGVLNWFSENDEFSKPVAAIAGSPNIASLSPDLVVTYTFAVPPLAGQQPVEFQLIFD